MRIKNIKKSGAPNENDALAGIQRAILRLLEPLAQLVEIAGLSASDFYDLYEMAAVRIESESQRKAGSQISISEISATTGISRDRVSRILKVASDPNHVPRVRSQQPANRVLIAWRQKAKFKKQSGEPAQLYLYGKGVSFDLLARKNGAGIPTRAILNVLIRAGAVEITGGDVISLKTNTLCRVISDGPVLESFVEQLRSVMDFLVRSTTMPSATRCFFGKYRIPMLPSMEIQIRDDILASGFRLVTVKGENGPETSKGDLLLVENGLKECFLTLFCLERCDATTPVSGTSQKKRSNYKRK